ncbi:MAG: pyridoxamine 5'-phosphate oxidase family protein [Micrococcales bacterium]|nr:pyridoxamine 5'-phosphate oxidase family protein [Micrococcales bacterium]MBT5398605.1 pyridoxamine 5'-phosphate oxidase family protein [Micrococcales bacterium]MBT5848741.1 pyridoxamine 5'-phosphate oxidase family protein [Micrococcales bacterium]MBT7925739.1 pyridoxamine 5'-phosphate oxidase family protein [Micrococcales bacterium]
MSTPTPPGSSDKTTLKRLSYKASGSTSDLYDILDLNMVAHVGFVIDGAPMVIPMAYGRSGEKIYLHGSSGSRLMRHLDSQPQVCISITELNALKVSRSTFNSGMHYRSVVIFGKAELVAEDQKMQALDIVSDALIPGRVPEARPMTKKEAAATIIVSVDLNETSVKIATNEVDDPEEDMNRGFWAGTIPLASVAQPAVPADEESAGLPVPKSVRDFIAKRSR